jgi:hypothetical protein
MAANGVTRASHVQFNGLAAAGSCVLPSSQPGDRVVGVVNLTTGNNESSSFETSISKAGQIQQTSAANIVNNSYWAFLCG